MSTSLFVRVRARAIALSIGVAAGSAMLLGSMLVMHARAADDATKPSAPKPALSVTTTQLQRSTLPLRFTANGSIAAWQEASIGTEANGLRLAEVRVNVGDVVKRGQVLATFAPDTVQAEVALIDLARERLLAWINLYRALGGGWTS